MHEFDEVYLEGVAVAAKRTTGTNIHSLRSGELRIFIAIASVSMSICDAYQFV